MNQDLASDLRWQPRKEKAGAATGASDRSVRLGMNSKPPSQQSIATLLLLFLLAALWINAHQLQGAIATDSLALPLAACPPLLDFIFEDAEMDDGEDKGAHRKPDA
jgi:hypothetical protein